MTVRGPSRGMLLRALARAFVLLIVIVVAWSFRRGVAGTRGTRRRARPRRVPVPAPGALVRDRVCNTFLPVDRALRAEVGSETHYFCSEGCRDKFVAGDAHSVLRRIARP